MALVEWSEACRVGVDELDAQHQRFFALLNVLYEAMTTGKGSAVVDKSLEDVLDYTRSHFAAEEAYMVQQGYPQAAQHKVVHEEFVRQMLELVEAQRQGRGAISIEMMTAMREWLMRHILGVDRLYGPSAPR